jgi:hypothetical protein
MSAGAGALKTTLGGGGGGLGVGCADAAAGSARDAAVPSTAKEARTRFICEFLWVAASIARAERDSSLSRLHLHGLLSAQGNRFRHRGDGENATA